MRFILDRLRVLQSPWACSLISKRSCAAFSSSSAEATAEPVLNGEANSPSKVLHFASISEDACEAEFRSLLAPFGYIRRVVVLRSYNKALVEMRSLEEAAKVLEQSASGNLQLRGTKLNVSYSIHQKLLDTTAEPPPGDLPDNCIGKVLVLHIRNPVSHITVDVLHEVFKTYGFVQKIVIGQHSPDLHQSFIEMDYAENAVSARDALHGRDLYDGCCKLQLRFSRLPFIRVRFNNELARDFRTEPVNKPEAPSILGPASQMPWTAVGRDKASEPFPASSTWGNTSQPFVATWGGASDPFVPSATRGKCLIVGNVNPEVSEEKLFNLFCTYGNVLKIRMLNNQPGVALVEMADAVQGRRLEHFLHGVPLFGKHLSISLSKHDTIKHPDACNFAHSGKNFHKSFNLTRICPPSKVLFVSNLPDDAKEEDMMAHFSPHGKIESVTLFDSIQLKKLGLVEFENVQQATEAIVCKQATPLKANSPFRLMRIVYSRWQDM